MNKIQLPADVASQLGPTGFPAELCDETGAVKAVAVPPDVYRAMCARERWERTPVEDRGYTTSEAIAYLRGVERGRARD